MPAEARVFLDTSVLFAAVLSETGASRLILKLGEAGTLQVWVGARVLQEADAVLARKAAGSKAFFALLLDRARVRVGPAPDQAALLQATAIVEYPPDAHILAEALAAEVEYLVSLDREHLVGNPRASELPFPIGTPGDFLAWFRQRLRRSYRI
jgi:predicted nucleic acid-binding protein